MPKKKKKAAKKNAASFAMLAGPNPEEAQQFLNVARTMLVGNDGTNEGSKYWRDRLSRDSCVIHA
jgi:hypothetical protein